MKRRHTCNELGLCQVAARRALGLAPVQPCDQCAAPRQPRPVQPLFAPGSIEAYRRRKSAWSKTLRAFVAAAPLAFAIGLAVGWLRGKGWL